jgi:Cys-rich protein (TIGR01571 family)
MPCAQHGLNAQRYAQKLDPQASNFWPEATVFCLVGTGAFVAATVASSFDPSLSILTCCLPNVSLAGVTQLSLRRKVREMYGISENDSCFGSDLLTTSFCLCCNLIQVSRQLKKQPPSNRR